MDMTTLPKVRKRPEIRYPFDETAVVAVSLRPVADKPKFKIYSLTLGLKLYNFRQLHLTDRQT
jgi:hypothetical protein